MPFYIGPNIIFVKMPLAITIGLEITLQPAIGAPAALSVPLLKQEQTQWCWAACMQMAFQHADSADTTAQCGLANTAFDMTGCCASPGSSLCNRPLPIQQVASEWDRWNYRASYKEGYIEFLAVQFEIDQGKPIELGLKWTNGAGHAVLVIGYITDATSQKVIVNDPWEGQKSVAFSEMLTAYGLGQWAWTWAGIHKR